MFRLPAFRIVLIALLALTFCVGVCSHAQDTPESEEPATTQQSLEHMKELVESLQALNRQMDKIRKDLESFQERREDSRRKADSPDSLIPKIYERRQRGLGMAQLHELARQRTRLSREREELLQRARKVYQETLGRMDEEIADLESAESSPDASQEMEKLIEARRNERKKFERTVQAIASEIISDATRQRLGTRLWQGDRPPMERRDREGPELSRRVADLEQRLDVLEQLLLDIAQKLDVTAEYQHKVTP